MELENERALLIYPSGPEFIAAFLGCLYAKVVAVPAYPPTKTRGTNRLESIFQNSGAKIAMTTEGEWQRIQKSKKLADSAFIHSLEVITSDTLDDELASQWTLPEISGDTLAFLQYTSGSTGTPKGVMVSHGNILSNAHIMVQTFFPKGEDSRIVSWLPIYHDMGLIGCILAPLYDGDTMYNMPPTAFLERPARWIRAFSRYKGNMTAAPNFAYDLCAEKIKEEELEGVDLSSWKTAVNGSEVVRANTLESFIGRFSPYGFDNRTFFPSYGMAETTLLISAGTREEEAKVLFIDGEALEDNKVIESAPGMKGVVSMVGCGAPRGCEVLIVNPDTFEKLGDNKVGEIWVKGPSVAQGYWQREEQTRLTFHAHTSDTKEGPFLRTGDLGFTREGEVYVSGRLKDLIIIRGRNHYPHDIEETVQNAHPALTVNGGAAFTIDLHNEERLVIVQEVERTHLRNLNEEEVFDAIRKAVTDVHEIQVFAITLLSPGRLPRTTSGKIQHRGTKKAFLDDTLHKVGEWRLPIQEVPEGAGRDENFAPNPLHLLEMPISERIPILQKYFQTLAARTLRMPADQVDIQKPAVNLGLDSMHAIEIKGNIEADLGFEVEVTQFMEGLTLADLSVFSARKLDDVADKIREGMKAKAAPTATKPEPDGPVDLENITPDQARELLVDIDNLSPEQVEKLLEILGNE
jgi:acyl-CoA synthetase (AMP-forming)/AMP-acid ligase II/acyl carrier protein